MDEKLSFEYGKFAHIVDAESNRVELWEPNDEEYDQLIGGEDKVNSLYFF